MTALIPNLNGASRIYAIFGDPVAQVQTPTLINPLFAELDFDVCAVPFHVTPAQFEAAFEVFSALPNVAAIGITVPHKIVAARRCDRLTPVASAVGAVNVVRRERDGSIQGALFDGAGFAAGLGDNRARLQDASVLLMGAGGAGSAIAHALASEGIATLSVIDRDEAALLATIDMANHVAGREVAVAGAAELRDHTVLINATPLGLKPDDALPLDLRGLTDKTLVADIAALSRETELLRIARERGCATSDGHNMLRAQIALVAGFVTGRDAGVSIGAPGD